MLLKRFVFLLEKLLASHFVSFPYITYLPTNIKKPLKMGTDWISKKSGKELRGKNSYVHVHAMSELI